MAQPAFVPQSPSKARSFYQSPQRTRGTWKLDRPGDVSSASLTSGNFQGPDQGYALLLADRFRQAVKLPADADPALSVDVALKGCVAVALKRASLLGRAPVSADIEVALTMWGFLDGQPAEELVSLRQKFFAGLDHDGHKVPELLALCSESVLVSPAAQIRELIEADPLAAFVLA